MPHEISSPYQFVPLSNWVHHPDWAAKVNHDLPFKDGLSGSFTITLKNHTPLFVGDENKQFFTMPDGTPTIPGTSTKGMLRSVIEIISYGKMANVDDRRFGIRDLSKNGHTRDLYQNKIIGNPASAGFLQLIAGEIKLIPCDFFKLPHELIKDHFRTDISKVHTTRKKYETLFGDEAHSGNISFEHNDVLVTQLGQGDNVGEIVMTGDMQKKKNEFMFYNRDTDSPLAVDDKLWRAFVDVNDSATSDFSESLKGHWLGFWKDKFFDGERVPVFYHRNRAGEIDSFGLAFLYKLPYENTLKEIIAHTSKDHLNEVERDLAELMFGYIDESETTGALKGRISIGHAQAVGKYQWDREYDLVLMNARPTFYPNYIKQKTANGGQVNKYVSYGDSSSEVSGWKRYPVHKTPNPLCSSDKGAIISRLKPLQAGAEFKTNIRFHNLKSVELGALYWALSWGDESNLRHSLGMGKPYGFGQVSIQLNDEDCQSFIANSEEANIPRNISDFIQVFESYMEQAIIGKQSSDWYASPAITQLKGMANPENAMLNSLSYMQLKDYQDAKGAGLCLKTYKMVKTEKTSKSAPNSAGRDWVSETAESIAKANNSKYDDVIRGKLLAAKWSEIPEADLKAEALLHIQSFWHVKGWWDLPPGKASKVVRNIYEPKK